MRNYTVMDGLPSSEVYEAFQDSKGFMWFLSDGGVSRFDGYRFRNFNLSSGLPDNTVFKCSEDKKGRLWFLSYSGSLAYHYNGKIYTPECNGELVRKVAGDLVQSLYVDKADTVWIGTNSSIFILYQSREKWVLKERAMPGRDAAFVVFPDGYIFSGNRLNIDRLKLVGKGDTIAVDVKFQSQFLSPNIRETRLKNGDFLFSYETFICRMRNGKVISYVNRRRTITALREDQEGRIWCTLEQGGAEVFENGDILSEPVSYLRDLTVTNVTQDSEGAFWFTTLGKGVFYVSNRNVTNIPSEQGNRITCIYTLKDKIVAGTDYGRLVAFDVNTGKKQELFGVNNGNTFSRIRKVSDSTVYAVGNWGISHITWPGLQRKDLALNSVRDIVVESDSTLLCSYSLGQLVRVNPDKIVIPLEVVYQFPDQPYSLYYDHRKNLWISTLSRVWMYDGKTMHDLSPGQPLLKKRINCFLEPVKGQIWMASGGGVVIYDTQKRQARMLFTSGNLENENCKSLYKDATGKVWVSTSSGLHGITIDQNGNVVRDADFRPEDGLISNEVYDVTSYGNKLWVATNLGFSVIDLSKLRINNTPPPIYITSVAIHGKNVPLREKYDLTHDRNYLTITYVGLTYRKAGKARYKVKMEGIDSTWKYTGQQTIQYPTMPPGSYRFLVSASNEDGIWSAKPAVLEITIEAPYWQKAWFRLGIALIVLGLIFFVFTVRYNNLQRIEKEKSELHKRITEMELTALRAQMNPHFIFNALSSIQYFILENDARSANLYLGKFSRLIRSVLSNSRKDMIPLEDEIRTLELYIELEALRFRNKFLYRIEIGEELDPEKVQIPSMLLQPFIENAIWHGLMTKAEGGLLVISLSSTGENTLQAVIEDNGVGRMAATANKSPNRKEHQSMGITVTRERLETLKIKYNLEVSLEIEDLKDSSGKAAGTRVTLIFPLIRVND